jgi:dTDP-4-dehydrorhamnose 3,5-epimerase
LKTYETTLKEVVIIETKTFGDARGWFMETFNAEVFRARGLPETWAQDNHSFSTAGVVRGLHYQLEQPQGKLAFVVAGAVYDVAVDLRRTSPTFGRWVGMELSDTNHRQLWIPPGFAHGYYVLSTTADVCYKCTAMYAARHDRCIRWDDPDLAIDWPLLDGTSPRLSTKDAAAGPLRGAVVYP